MRRLLRTPGGVRLAPVAGWLDWHSGNGEPTARMMKVTIKK